MKKRFFALIFAGAMVFSAGAQAFGAEDISVYVDGEELLFDQKPIIQDGRTLVPMRVIFEALDSEVTWDSEEKRVNAKWDGDGLELFIGKNEMKLDTGMVIKLDVPAQILNSRTMVPLRAISETMDAVVHWDADTREIFIEKDFNPMDTFRFFNELGYVDESYLEHGIGEEKCIEIKEGTDGAFADLLAYKESYRHDLQMIFEEYVWNVENGGEDPDAVIEKWSSEDGFYVIYHADEGRIYMYMISRGGDIVRELTTFYFEGGEDEFTFLCERFFKTIETWKEPKG